MNYAQLWSESFAPPLPTWIVGIPPDVGATARKDDETALISLDLADDAKQKLASVLSARRPMIAVA